MMSQDKKRGKADRFLTSAVIIVSLAGIIYFGLRAVSDGSRSSRENPFAYDIDQFVRSGADRVLYSEVQTIPLPLPQVYAIALASDDRLYVSGVDSILILSRTGQTLGSLATVGPARCLAVDENQDLYAGMTDHMEVYAPGGSRPVRWESLGREAILTSIALSRDHVFAADAGNHIVWRFDKSGQNPLRIGDRDTARDIPGFIIPSPYFDVGIDPDGFLWAANTGRHSLENYTLEGGFRTAWGEFSMEIEGFCGCCNPSHFAILEDGSFVTSEKGIPRIKLYNRLGEMSGVVAGPDRFEAGTAGLDLALDASQRIWVLDPARRAVRIFAKVED
jgi:hypothetical protein